MLHFTSRAEWEAGRIIGEYQPGAMATEGFVHLSFGHQIAQVATDIARGVQDLVLLVVDPSGLEADLRIDGGFPHLYRPIPLTSVRLVVDFPPGPDGSFEVPDQARLAELAITAFPSPETALAHCRALMRGFTSPWWLGGGWAVDAAAGTVSRAHLDLDVVVLRPDAAALGHHLDGWDLRLARDGSLSRWEGGDLAVEDHQIWARPDDGLRPNRWQDFAADPGFVEFLVEQVDPDGAAWAYRRDPWVSAPLERLGPSGSFLSPEVALLYKAPAAAGSDAVVAAKANSDFEHAADHLDRDQREWLGAAVARAYPGHRWMGALE